MSTLTPEQALEQSRATAVAAQRAADSAQAIADQIATVVSTATHGAVDPTVFRFAIFVLAIFVGYYVVWSVTPALHTPLMSVTNAISSVIIVGALIAAASAGSATSKWLGLAAVSLASVNIFGGFAVTQRMLSMYKKRERKDA